MRTRRSGRKPKRQTDMRKIRRILTIGAMLLSGSLCAQHYIGVRGGWGGGSSRLVPARETGTEWGLYSGGLSYKFYTDSKFVGGIQADLQYMGRGYMYDQFRDADTSYHRTVNSLELPFMWQPHFYILRRHARVYLNLGVYMSYHLNSEYYWKSKREGIYHRDEYEMKNTRDNRWGYGLCGGGGISVFIRRFEVAFEARYYYGYSDILKNKTKYQGNPLRSPLDNINLSMAVYYRLSKEGIRSAPSKNVARKMEEAAARKALRRLERQRGDEEVLVLPEAVPEDGAAEAAGPSEEAPAAVGEPVSPTAAGVRGEAAVPRQEKPSVEPLKNVENE